jgi:hypothetical protein
MNFVRNYVTIKIFDLSAWTQKPRLASKMNNSLSAQICLPNPFDLGAVRLASNVEHDERVKLEK